MLQFRLFAKGNKTLHVEIKEGNGWDFSTSTNGVFLITTVIEMFLNELDPEFLFSGCLTIANDPEADAPITLWGKDFQHCRINLSISTNNTPPFTVLDWPQMAFQLSHELVHFFAGENSFRANNWFMETIAEIASLFFLEKMSNLFSQYPADQFRSYAILFSTYRHNRLEKVPWIDRNDALQWFQANSQLLNCSKMNRELNLQAAKILLPLFESQPGSWNVLRFAPLVNSTLSGFLHIWIARCPEGNHPCRHLLEECHTIFLGNAESEKETPKTPAG